MQCQLLCIGKISIKKWSGSESRKQSLVFSMPKCQKVAGFADLTPSSVLPAMSKVKKKICRSSEI